MRHDLPPDDLTAEQDAFGHSDYAAALASLLLESEPPLTLGLFGPWGVGKTTVIEEVGRQVQDRAAFAYFDAWRYEGDGLRRQFLRDVAGQLYPSESDFDPEKELIDLDQSRSTKIERIAGFSGEALRETLIRVILAFVIILILLQVIDAESLRDKHGTFHNFVVSGLLALLLFAVAPLTRIFRVTEDTLTASRLEDPEHFTERFGALLAKLKKDRLVVAIDNLDRCTPDRVEELLSTIKTYLEPVGQTRRTWLLSRLFRKPAVKQAVFVISADDAALRRHLESKEASASAGAHADNEISRYVDEYLRKFFTASVRIRPLLDTDMRAFTEGELSAFLDSRKLDDDVQAALIQMVASALSRNPRRVKQFANNLETRLRVVEQREAAGRINPPISSDVLIIAKLAILEEEWPRKFAELERNPRVLDEWHIAAVEGELSGGASGDDSTFARFLSRSRNVRADNLSAFLRLKQSTHELDLPRYADFRSALSLGTPDEVDSVLGEDSANGQAYAELLPDLLEEELASSNVDGARNIVEAATAVPLLASEEAVVRRLLTRAIGDPQLRASLISSRPEPLLTAARLLDSTDRDRLLVEFVDLTRFARSADRLEQVSQALAANIDLLSPSLRPQLRRSLASSEVMAHMDALLPLAEAQPGLIPPDLTNLALSTLSTSFDVAAPPFRLLRESLGAPAASADVQGQFLLQLAAGVTAQRTAQEVDPEKAIAVLEQIRDAASRLTKVASGVVDQFFASQAVALTSWHVASWPALLDVAGTVAKLDSGVASPHLARFVSEFFAQAPDEAIAYAARGGAVVPDALHQPLLDHLTPTASGDPQERRIPAAEAIVSLDPDDKRGMLRAAAEQCIERGLFNRARGLIEKNASLTATRNDFADRALQRLESVQDADLLERGFRLLAYLVPDMGERQRDDFRAALNRFIQSGDQGLATVAAGVAGNLEESDSFAQRTRELVKLAFEHLKGLKPAPPTPLLFVAERLRLLTRLEQAGFITHLASLIRDPAERANAMAATKLLPDLEPSERTTIVEALIEIEVMEPDPANRGEMLRLARRVARNRGAASKAVKERLAELAEGSDADREVHRAVSESKNG